jgi:hypothetical protein
VGVLAIYVLVFTVFCIVCTVFCIVCTVFLYCFVYVRFICFVCTSVRSTATEWKLECSNNNNNNNNRSGRTMALGSTQSLSEMSTRNISWGLKTAGP